MTEEKKHCLIIEGGGFKTAFTAGVTDSFMTSNYNPFNRYVAVSGGTVALSYFLSGQFRFCLDAMQYLAKDIQFTNFKRTFGKEGYMDIDFIKNVAEELVPFDFEKAFKKTEDKKTFFVVTNRKFGNPEYFEPICQKTWMEYSIASSTLPFVTKGKHKIKNKSFFDGGWSDPLPVKWAYENGAREIVVLRTSPASTMKVQSWTDYFGSIYFGASPGLKKAFAFSHEKYNEAIQFMEHPPEDLNLIQIAPEVILKSGTYVYTEDTIVQDYRHGVEMGMRFLYEKMKGNLNPSV